MKKPLLLLLILSFFVQIQANPKTFTRIIATGNDDGREHNTTGAITLGRVYLELAGKSSEKYHAVRFGEIDIPPNAVISDAYIEFYAYGSSSAGNMNIKAEIGDAGTYTTSARNISSRSYSAGSVSWTTEAWKSREVKRTPNLKTIIEENLASGKWFQKNGMAFLIEGLTGNEGAAAYAYEGGSSYRPKLIINYETDGSEEFLPKMASYVVNMGNNDGRELYTKSVALGSTSLELGGRSDGNIQAIRFVEVTIPEDAEILAAYIEFYASSTSAPAGMNITAEIGSPAIYATSSGNISSRTYSDNYVTWITEAWSTNYQKHTTPDLRNIIDENRLRGWTSGGNLAFKFEGLSYNNGASVRSYEGGSAYRPTLVIRYQRNGTGPFITPQESGTLAAVTATGKDDGRESSTGSMNTSSTTLELGGRSDGNIQAVRFPNIRIPEGAEIEEAYIEFYSSGTSSKAASIDVRIETGNSSEYATTSKNITNRSYSNSKITWITSPWKKDKVKHVTPNLKKLIDERLSSGWTPGGAIAFKFEGLTANSGAVVRSYEGGSDTRPRLIIKYKMK